MTPEIKFINALVHHDELPCGTSLMNFRAPKQINTLRGFFKFIMMNFRDELMSLPKSLYFCGFQAHSKNLTQGPLLRNGGKLTFCPHTKRKFPARRECPGMVAHPHHHQREESVMEQHDRKIPRSILALDLGRTTGWALALPEGRIYSGTEEFRPGRFESSGMALLRFRSWLSVMHQQGSGLAACVFEEVRRHNGTTAAHTYGEFLGQLKAWADEDHNNVPYLGVPVGTIKKFATGKGNAGKDEMIEAVRTRLGHPDVADHNEADALAILHWAMKEGPVQFQMKEILK